MAKRKIPFIEPNVRRRAGARPQQQEQIEPHQPAVGVVEVFGNRGMSEPDRADRGEAHKVGEVGRPLVEDGAQKVLLRAGGYRGLQHEQRDSDREDAVTERLQTRRTKGKGTPSLDVLVTHEILPRMCCPAGLRQQQGRFTRPPQAPARTRPSAGSRCSSCWATASPYSKVSTIAASGTRTT